MSDFIKADFQPAIFSVQQTFILEPPHRFTPYIMVASVAGDIQPINYIHSARQVARGFNVNKMHATAIAFSWLRLVGWFV